MVNRTAKDDVAGALLNGLLSTVPELPAVTLEFSKRVARMHALIVSATSEVLHSHGLSHGEYDVLSTLRATGEPFRLAPSTLAQRLLFTSGGVSNLVKSLENRALVARLPDAHDRRRFWVQLTALGAEKAASVLIEATAAQALLLEVADREDVHRVIAGLAQILPSVEDARQETAS